MAEEIALLKQQGAVLARMATDLHAQTQALDAREVEMTQALDAMGQIIDALETGSGRVVNGKLHIAHQLQQSSMRSSGHCATFQAEECANHIHKPVP